MQEKLKKIIDKMAKSILTKRRRMPYDVHINQTDLETLHDVV